jgi:hypothetical protein
VQDIEPPGGCALNGPGAERLLDGIMMCRSVAIYAVCKWFDLSVDLGTSQASNDQWSYDAATVREVERLRATLHAAVDATADLKLSIGAQRRIQ